MVSVIQEKVQKLLKEEYTNLYLRYKKGENVKEMCKELRVSPAVVYINWKKFGLELDENRWIEAKQAQKGKKKRERQQKNKEKREKLKELQKKMFPELRQFGGEGVYKKWK